MTRGRFGVLVLAVVASGWLVAPVGGQDSTTLLTQFLTDLRAGVVGTSQELSVAVENGTAAAPSLTFKNDPNTGLFHDAVDNIIRISSGGTQIAQFDDNPGLTMSATARLGWSDTLLCRGGENVIGIGGCTSSFPAWKRSGTSLEARLADDSTWANLSAGEVTNVGARVTAGSGTGVTVNDSGLLRQQVYRLTVTSAQFISAATTHDFTVATLPAKTILKAIYADLTTTFACAATCTSTTLSATVGSTAGGTNLLVSFDADAAAAVWGDADAELGTGINRASAIQGGFLGSWTTTTPVSLRLTSGTGNLGTGAATNLSQGSLTVYLITERLP